VIPGIDWINGKIPPGQMKKKTGANSAKQYAPGQGKMNN